VADGVVAAPLGVGQGEAGVDLQDWRVAWPLCGGPLRGRRSGGWHRAPEETAGPLIGYQPSPLAAVRRTARNASS